MPLPQQVINQLTEDHPETQGWLWGVILFSVAILVIVLVFYFGLLFVYQPYLENSLASVQQKVATTDQSIASGDQAKLMTFYSQTTNLQTLLANHVEFSQLLSWLENNTEANIYYSQFSFGNDGQLSLTAVAQSEADVNQQIAIFESSPEIRKLVVSNISLSTAGTSWSFTATLLVDPSLLLATTTNS